MVLAVMSSALSRVGAMLLGAAPGRGEMLLWLAIALVVGAAAAALHAAKADGKLNRLSPLGRRGGASLPPPD